jgi:nucleotide-binding universal stress UspA family protein
MQPIKTILAPIDFSDRSAVAAQHAVALAQHFGSRVIFSHVIEAAPAEFRAQALGHAFEEAEWFPHDTQELIRAASRERLGKLVADVGCDVDLHLEGLEPISYVNEVIEQTDADVLVVGRSIGHGPLGGPRGNAYAMIREARCPVISV